MTFDKKAYMKKYNKTYSAKHKKELKTYKKKYYNQHKPEYQEHSKKYYLKNRDQVKASARSYYYSHRQKRIAYGSESGYINSFISRCCCVICFEYNPFILENHHIFGKKDDLTFTFCSNHHRLLGTKPIRPKILEFFERENGNMLSECPNCKTLNKPSTVFCKKCKIRLVESYG